MWTDEGCFKPESEEGEEDGEEEDWNGEEDWEGEFMFCEDYDEDKCHEIPFCKWTDWGCEESDYDWCDEDDEINFGDIDFSFCYELDSDACDIVPFCSWDSNLTSCGINQWGWGNGVDGLSFGFGNWNWNEAGFDLGDINIDSFKDILDVIKQVNFIINADIPTDYENWSSDLNSDENIDVVDVVLLSNTIINNVSRSMDATHAELKIIGNTLNLYSNGHIGGIQMTLAHDSSFNIELTDMAYVSDYKTSNNITRLIVINPETDEIFSSYGDYDIIDVVVSSSNNYVSTVDVSSFNLNPAYPNPFNPITNIKLDLNQTEFISVKVYNIVGQMIDLIVEGELSAGVHTLTWDASRMASGAYFIRAESSTDFSTEKVLLVK